jgi:hypothetical protein
MGCAVASSGDIARIKGSCSMFSSCNLRRMYFCLSVSGAEFMRQFYHWACPLSGHKAVFTNAAMPLCLAYPTFGPPCLFPERRDVCLPEGRLKPRSACTRRFQFPVHGIGIGPLMRHTFNYARDNSHHLHALEASTVATWLAQWSLAPNQPHRLFVPQ